LHQDKEHHVSKPRTIEGGRPSRAGQQTIANGRLSQACQVTIANGQPSRAREPRREGKGKGRATKQEESDGGEEDSEEEESGEEDKPGEEDRAGDDGHEDWSEMSVDA
jgi:hypothetical protein